MQIKDINVQMFIRLVTENDGIVRAKLMASDSQMKEYEFKYETHDAQDEDFIIIQHDVLAKDRMENL